MNHQLVVTLDREDVSVSLTCPYDHSCPDDRSKPWDAPDCACWSNDDSMSCICGCEACLEGDHGECDEGDDVPDVGRKWCDAFPDGQCFYVHAIDMQGTDMINVVGPLVASFPVEVSGNGWEEPLDISLAEEKV